MSTPRGEVPEWLNGAVSKTVVVLWATVGSNPTLSARKGRPYIGRPLCFLYDPGDKLPGSKRLWGDQRESPIQPLPTNRANLDGFRANRNRCS